MRIFKIWLRQGLREKRHFERFGPMQPLTVTPIPSDDDVVAEVKGWRANRLDEGRARGLAADFGQWLEQFTASNYRERAKKAAAKRWKKDKKSS